MKKLLIISIATLLFGYNSYAQDTKLSAGLRLGPYGGLTGKYFLSSERAVEGIIGGKTIGWWRGYGITGLYEIHAAAFEVEGLYWYYGGGGHIQMLQRTSLHPKHRNIIYTTEPVIGIDGILGIEYRIKEVPFVVSLDIKPAFHILGDLGLAFMESALSVRYVIK
jgi:hypothetical protein